MKNFNKQMVTGFSLALGLLALSAGMAVAASDYMLTIKDHTFSPQEITIPAKTKVKLVIKNMDPTPEEFESHKLHREKVIQGNSQAVIYIGPLEPGVYPFIGEFHQDTAKGQIIVK